MEATLLHRYLYKTKVDVNKHSEFIDDITYEKRDLLVRDLCVEGAVWTSSHQKSYTMYHRFLILRGKIWFHFVNCKLKPSTHSTRITLERMCLIHSIIKGRNIDVGAILHQEIAECVARQIGILVFPTLVMLLYQQRGIVPRASEEVLENKGPINEASVKRMTRGNDTLILKEAKTNKKERDGIFANQEDTIVEKKVSTTEDEVVTEGEVAENKKEKDEEDFIKKIVTALESVGVNIDNLEQAGVRLTEVIEVTSEEQSNSLAIVLYTGPLQVASPT
ncbi:hypothetical protein J1N35_034413 [Gossypium stocksii]|uniref:Putative plant transposon protein domain-containing protein n=1 Tax=Gossypium stocksii TaxID=47602 RepID=A0A9D3ZQ68_9ROSI|nr:hypothetical protein J1N35_034413 [Gossypium stocksii]